MSAIFPDFSGLNNEQKLLTILCPFTLEMTKCVSKFLGIMTNIRKEIDFGLSPDNLKYYEKHKV